MIYIGICDDVHEEGKMTLNSCEKYFEKDNIDHIYETFDSGEDVLLYCEKNESHDIDILFLDVEMSGINGINLKDILINESKIRHIVFVTNHDESVYEAFSKKTIGFIQKPVKQEYINKMFDLILDEMMKKIVIIVNDVNGYTREIGCDDIIYIKALGSYTQIVIDNITENSNNILSTKKLGSWEKLLKSSSIIRVHKSYMVNISKISKMSGNEVSLNGMIEKIPLGRKYKSDVKKKYMDYIERKVLERLC